jgi:hypothetical protein
VLTVGATVAVTPKGEAHQADLFETLHATYRAGHPLPFPQTFPNQRAFIASFDRLARGATRRTSTWEPSRVGVSLEIALAAIDLHWPAGVRLLSVALGRLLDRPSAPGQDAAADRFEWLFHHAALATLISRGPWTGADTYIATIAHRVADAPVPGRSRLVDRRFLLTIGWLAEARTSPLLDTVDGGSMPSLKATAGSREAYEAAERALARAAAVPDCPAEALVRHAFALHRLGRDREAAAQLARVDPASMTDDPVLRYWHELVAGRVDEAREAFAEAERSYANAANVWPHAQTPLIALGSLLERRGRPTEAETWIARVRSLPPDASDPWWDYWSGDRRWIPAWMAELRQVRP